MLLKILEAIFVLPFSLMNLYWWFVWIVNRGELDRYLGDAASRVIHSLSETPDRWHQFDHYTLDYSDQPIRYSFEAPLRLWVSSGRHYLELQGKDNTKYSFNWLEKRRIWTALQQWRTRHAVSPLSEYF